MVSNFGWSLLTVLVDFYDHRTPLNKLWIVQHVTVVVFFVDSKSDLKLALFEVNFACVAWIVFDADLRDEGPLTGEK